MRTRLVIPGALAAAAMAGAAAPAADRPADALSGVTAVAAKVSGDYARVRLPDGSFQPETYSFGQGGKWGGELSDPTMDRLQFMDVAQSVAAALSSQNYVPVKDTISSAKLLIMVYWGTTQVPGPTSDSVAYDQLAAAQNSLNGFLVASPSRPGAKVVSGGAEADAAMAQMSAALTMLNMENEQRDRTDFKNAHMLGYDSEGLIGTDFGRNMRGTALDGKRVDLVSEIEENRYFVVLMAYDFQLLWKQKKHKLLWETRFSINERHNAFDKALPAMAQYASRYFGQDSHGLLRAQVPEGRVEVGEPKALGEVEPPQK